MSLLDNFAHGVLVVLSAFVHFILNALDISERFFRGLMKGAGLSLDVQTVVLIIILSLILIGVMRLLGGRIRLVLGLVLILILAHTLAGLGNGPLGGG
jgi:hypothetical protein